MMKKINMFIVFVMLIPVILSGCGEKENSDVKALREKLIQFAADNDKNYFQIDLDMENFDITLGSRDEENSSRDTLIPLTSTNIEQKIYLTGRFKGEPEEVESFLVIYDPIDKKILQFGIQQIGETDVTFIDVE